MPKIKTNRARTAHRDGDRRRRLRPRRTGDGLVILSLGEVGRPVPSTRKYPTRSTTGGRSLPPNDSPDQAMANGGGIEEAAGLSGRNPVPPWERRWKRETGNSGAD